jgi:hypothetical protein
VPRSQKRVRANVYRLGSDGAGHTVSRVEYRRLCRSFDGDSLVDVYITSLTGASLRAGSFRKSLTRSLNNRKSSRLNSLIVEVLSPTARASEFDRLCSAIETAESETTVRIDRIVFVVNSRQYLEDSVLFADVLLKLCASKRIRVFLTSPDVPELYEAFYCEPADEARVGHVASEPRSSRVVYEIAEAGISLGYHYIEPEGTVSDIDSQEIRDYLEVFNGHFLLQTSGGDVHVRCVLSVGKLASHRTFVQRVKSDLDELFLGNEYSIVPFGVDQEGLDRLSLAVLRGDSRRRLRPHNADYVDNVVLLFDSFNLHPDYLARVAELEVPPDRIAIVEVAGASTNGAEALHRISVPQNRLVTYVDLGDLVRSWPPSECPMCWQGVPVLPTEGLEGGRSIDGYARAIHKYDSFTFWSMLSTSDEYLEIGHWPSSRTRNHYDLRVRAAPIFRDFGWDIARRIRNGLESVGVLSGWLSGMLCTEGEESDQLAGRLGHVLGIPEFAILRVPRAQLVHVAGKDIGDGLAQWLLEARAGERIGGRNVVILDQAAHHFRTYSSLRSIADYLDCSTLAFAVFLDRTGLDFDFGQHLHSTHYLPLYSWPAPPRRDCNCNRVAHHVA